VERHGIGPYKICDTTATTLDPENIGVAAGIASPSALELEIPHGVKITPSPAPIA